MDKMSSDLQNVLLYLSAFFMVFLSFVVFSLCLRVLLWIYMQYYNRLRTDSRRGIRNERLPGRHYPVCLESDRQGNIFTIADEAANNPLPHRCTDFYYVDPTTEDAARIRAQLEKDEKDLPTYEEVMAMSAAQTAAGSLASCTAPNSSVTTTDTTVPPYSEVERNVMHSAQPLPTNANSSAVTLATLNTGATVRPAGVTAASTSRAAAAAATGSQTTVVTIANSVSNTSV
ncbi:uncharacterized protein LOC128867190 isoform X2 [Anastrepha ludens]|uniref:uncharacterized protein LOC128867190 isoform X2 n=1 Tax=Anastrepha ludens TaxID=28586 RepID=UPI0023AEFC52|nr:uncharacterized protein LOC128867190 isoform X2 [Anastrepha ludens]